MIYALGGIDHGICDDVIKECIENKIFYRAYTQPRAGSGVVTIDPLRFLAGCRTRRLNQV